MRREKTASIGLHARRHVCYLFGFVTEFFLHYQGIDNKKIKIILSGLSQSTNQDAVVA